MKKMKPIQLITISLLVLALVSTIACVPESTMPTQPEAPETEQPIIPEQPTLPPHVEQPTAPEEPLVPEQPTVPEEPLVPEQPTAPEEPLVPEQPSVPEQATDPGYDSHAIDVKFIEGSIVRLEEGILVSHAGYDLDEFYAVLEAFYPYPLDISPLFTRPLAMLEYEHEQAEEATGEDIPDLTLFFRVLFEEPVKVKAIMVALNELKVVEYASQVPLPMPLHSSSIIRPPFSISSSS